MSSGTFGVLHILKPTLVTMPPQTSAEEAARVWRVEEDDGGGEGIDEGPHADDQEDAAVPEGAEQLLDAPPPCLRLHGRLPQHRPALQGGTGEEDIIPEGLFPKRSFP